MKKLISLLLALILAMSLLACTDKDKGDEDLLPNVPSEGIELPIIPLE